MDIHIHQQDGLTIFRMVGDLRRGDPVDDLKNKIDEAVARGDVKLVLNIGQVNMIDSSGIGIIVRGHTTTVQRGGGLRLVKPSKFAMQTLKICGLLNVLVIFDEEEAALASLR
jgi:anti-anti-sigma factor